MQIDAKYTLQNAYLREMWYFFPSVMDVAVVEADGVCAWRMET